MMNKTNQHKTNNESADLIIVNGHIATQDEFRSFVSGVAIKNGFFIATGTDKEILDYKNDKTKVIDVGGRTVIPGLNDSHLHIIRAGLNYNMELRWDGIPSLGEALRRVREQVHKPLIRSGCEWWVVGRNFNLMNGAYLPLMNLMR